MKHKVNNEYGKNYFGGKFKFFCSYISFKEQIKSKIAFLYKEIFRSFIKDGFFSHVSICQNKNNLIKMGIQGEFAEAIINESVKDYLESLSRYKLEEMSTAWDQKFLVRLPDLFLNQTVRSLKAAGFHGGILVIDDIENLTDRSTKAEIENFIKDLGNAFFRAGNEASNDNFFTIILTTHLQSALKISSAWDVAGLSASIPLAAHGKASVVTRKPDLEQGIDIVIQFMKFYRLPEFKIKKEFYPFNKEAIEIVVKECDFHPRRFLSRFYRIIIEALSNDVKEITSDFVRTVPEIEEEKEEPLGIEEL